MSPKYPKNNISKYFGTRILEKIFGICKNHTKDFVEFSETFSVCAF